MNNRKLKFRIWDNLKKEWVQNKGIWRIVTNDSGIGEITAPISFKQHPQGYSIQQFTGFEDHYGTEIYEGDIVKSGNLSGEIVFRSGSWLFNGHPLINYIDSVVRIGDVFDVVNK